MAHVKRTKGAWRVARDAYNVSNAPRFTPHALHHRHGMALVETALVLVLLVMLSFGAIEYGWMFTMQGHVTNAARHGARRAAMPDANIAAVQAEVEGMLTDAGLNGTVVIGNVAVGQPLTVTVTAPYQQLTFLPAPANLRSEVTMLKEGS